MNLRETFATDDDDGVDFDGVVTGSEERMPRRVVIVVAVVVAQAPPRRARRAAMDMVRYCLDLLLDLLSISWLVLVAFVSSLCFVFCVGLFGPLTRGK